MTVAAISQGVPESCVADACLHVVTWDAPRLVAALRTGYGHRRGLRITVMETLPGLLDAALTQRADVVILPYGIVSAHAARALAGGLRARLPIAKVLLALPRERHAVEEDLTIYDGLVSLDEPERDLALALEPLLARPVRAAARVGVTIPAEVQLADGAALTGVTVDISETGARLALHTPVAADRVRTIRFHREDGRQALIRCEVVWESSRAGQGQRLGVRFVAITLDALHGLRDLAFWRMRPEPDGGMIQVRGQFTEATSFVTLRTVVPTTPCLDLAGVSAVTAPGLLRWYDFLRALPPGVELRLRRVSAVLGDWFAVLPAMTYRCALESRLVCCWCTRCALEVESVVAWVERAPPGACAACGGPLEVGGRDFADLRLPGS